MASADSVCYTLINPSSEAELATEQQLKVYFNKVVYNEWYNLLYNKY